MPSAMQEGSGYFFQIPNIYSKEAQKPRERIVARDSIVQPPGHRQHRISPDLFHMLCFDTQILFINEFIENNLYKLLHLFLKVSRRETTRPCPAAPDAGFTLQQPKVMSTEV